jgi:small subunit ribosomal protein S20
MANIKSQMKRNRQNEKRRMRNRAVRSEIKTHAQAALDAAKAGDEASATEALRLAQKAIDRAATDNVLHNRTAARRKSQLVGQVRTLLS